MAGSDYFFFFQAGGEFVHRDDDEEVDGERDEEEVDDGGQDFAVFKDGRLIAENRRQGEDERIEIRLADQPGDKRVDKALDQAADDEAEGCAHDDTDGEINDVATGDEGFESR